VAFKQVRTIPEWETHFEGSSFNYLHSQGLCLVSSTNRNGTVVKDGTLCRVMNHEREVKWMLMRPKRPTRFLARKR